MNLKMVCFILMSFSLSGMELQFFMESPQIRAGIARIKRAVEEDPAIAENDQSKYKTLFVNTIKFTYKKLLLLQEFGLAADDGYSLFLMPQAYNPLISVLLKKAANINRSDSWDDKTESYYVVGIWFVLWLHKLKPSNGIPAESLELVQKFQEQYPHRAELCKYLHKFLPSDLVLPIKDLLPY